MYTDWRHAYVCCERIERNASGELAELSVSAGGVAHGRMVYSSGNSDITIAPIVLVCAVEVGLLVILSIALLFSTATSSVCPFVYNNYHNTHM